LFAWRAAKLAPLPFALANPIAMVNAWIGQNGFLTAGIFMWGSALLETRPLVAGAVLGLLVIKPQLALLLPIALLASRNWRAIAGGAASSTGLILVGVVVFGWGTFLAFVGSLPMYAGFLSHNRIPWNELASVFAALRLMGVPQTTALAVQIVVAAGAMIVTWRAWSARLPQRVPILAAASMLVSPYLFTYDALFLMIPFAWFVRTERHPGLIVIFWVCLVLPIVSYSGYYRGPNTIPLAAIICLWVLCREVVSPLNLAMGSSSAPSAAHPGTGGASRPRAGRGRRPA
jgi:hypothetical protein